MAKLEELIQGSQLREGKKRISEALLIGEREWENIRLSLCLCGDIGKFSKDDFMIGIISEDIIINHPLKSPTKSVSFYSPTYYPMYFVANLLKMDELIPEKGYRTIEALYTFVELATKAALRLGLEGNFAMGFGSGYANVRTGWIAEKGYTQERLKFEKIFFKNRSKQYNWDFHWNSVQADLKNAYEQFLFWRNNSLDYSQDSRSKAIVKPLIV
ncbi:MAG: hypothetical protein ACRENO_07525 [Thermodesulfobacteriota bacterium]